MNTKIQIHFLGGKKSKKQQKKKEALCTFAETIFSVMKKYSNTFHPWFIRLNWTSLILIYLVVIAGSFVRITGSGMGCPDWPKCFGQWVPPTDQAELPVDYKDLYATKRGKKIVKFAGYLEKLGFKKEAHAIRTDKSLLIEQDFNARKTWTEYINRLAGFLAGNAILFIFVWIVLRYRKRKLVLIAGINLVILVFQAWFGSIVVATNLVPWTITVHLFLALVIIALQMYLIRLIAPSQQVKIHVSKSMQLLIWVSFLITIVQLFLGTQVREEIDALTKLGFGRESWTTELGIGYYIHRSFSWLVLILLSSLAWMNYKGIKSKLLYWSFYFLAIELILGVLLAYIDMPGLVQTAHLVFACLLFAVQLASVFRIKRVEI